MHFFYQNDILSVEQCNLKAVAQQFKTPLYVYSKAKLIDNYQTLHQAFASIEHQICFAVKSNSNLAVLNVLAKQGAGFDIVSGGELLRVLKAGGDASKIVFSGLAKTEQDILTALDVGIACFNVESLPELDRLNQVAQRVNKKAPISLRVNPDVDAQTHPYISTGLKENKFGIAHDIAIEAYQYAQSLSHLDIVGIDFHIGSQLLEVQPFIDALLKVEQMIIQLKNLGIELKHIDIGGGLGIQYHQDEKPASPQQYAEAVLPILQRIGLKVYLEPGRLISANAGVLLTQIDLLKPTQYRNFAIVDAAMNDLIRPALYESWMDVKPVQLRSEDDSQVWDIVGSVCETGDFLAKDRRLALQENDLLAIMDAGAYGFVMSSNYNTRARAAEVMIDGDQAHLIRQRETVEQLWQNEFILAE